MYMGDVEIGVRGLVRGKLGDDIGGLVGQEQLGDIHGAFLQHLERGADTAGDGELDQGLQLRRARDADMDGQADARVPEAVRPGDDRFGFERELRGQRHLGIGGFREFLFPAQGLVDISAGPVGVDVLVALWVAGNVQTLETGLVKFTRLQELHGTVERAVRLGHAACEQKRLIHIRFALIAGDPIGQRLLVLDDARREVGHHGIAFGLQSLRGGDHILDRRALDMSDIDARAFGQKGAEILNLLGGAGHHLNGIILEKRLDLPIDGGRCGFVTTFEVQQSHSGLP